MTDTLTPAADFAAKRRPAFPGETGDYAAARQALLASEIELRRKMESVAEQRRALPLGPVIEKDYRFLDANGAELGLADLFGPHDTLVTFFWMYGPQRARPCPVCTNLVGAMNANAADVKQNAALKILGRSPVSRQLAFGRERGWAEIDFLQTVGDGERCARGLPQGRGRQGAAVLGRRDQRRDGRPRPGPARRPGADHPALAPARPHARRPRPGLVSEAEVLRARARGLGGNRLD
jgi:hypothetical protein